MKDNMVSIVIGNVCIYSKENTLEGKQASGLLLRLNVHEVLSLRGAIFKRLMHINQMVIWPSPWTGHCSVWP